MIASILNFEFEKIRLNLLALIDYCHNNRNSSAQLGLSRLPLHAELEFN